MNFMEHFGTNWGRSFVDYVLKAKEKGHLSISQRQDIIKLQEKKDIDKRFIKTGDPFLYQI